MLDANCEYRSAATCAAGVDFLAVAEESARIADQSGRRLDEFFAKMAQLDSDYIKSLECEVEQRCQRIARLEAELAIAWQELGETDAALDEAKRLVRKG